MNIALRNGNNKLTAVLSEMDTGKLVQKRKWNCPSDDARRGVWVLPKVCPSDNAARGAGVWVPPKFCPSDDVRRTKKEHVYEKSPLISVYSSDKKNTK